jgi:hypothetical protein
MRDGYKTIQKPPSRTSQKVYVYVNVYEDEINNKAPDKGEICWYSQHLLLGIYFGLRGLLN